MMTMFIILGIGLIICGIIFACAGEKEEAPKRNPAPPPLPNRRTIEAFVPSSIPPQAMVRSTARRTSSQLPARTRVPIPATTTSRQSTTNVGPRGVLPAQFPCCPYDRQRNIPGSLQKIFWNSDTNCYCCSRGHRFKSNGRPM